MNIVSSEYSRHSGLGNKLFSWSRAKIFARRHQDYKMLEPIWFSPHGGAVTRGGIDYSRALRKIWLYGNFKRSNEELSRFRYWIQFRHLMQYKFVWLKDAERHTLGGHVVFAKSGTGAEGHDFSEFEGESEFLLRSLYEITPGGKAALDRRIVDSSFIGVNIRCGNDFVSGTDKVGFQKTRVSWFCYALKEVRMRYGDLPAVIVSDGGPSQLAEILKEPNVTLLDSKTAIADLLTLAAAKVLLGSGNSSFSAWASFLGEMDTFTSVDTPFFHGKGLAYSSRGNKIVGLL